MLHEGRKGSLADDLGDRPELGWAAAWLPWAGVRRAIGYCYSLCGLVCLCIGFLSLSNGFFWWCCGFFPLCFDSRA
jgi:predicted cobalt transporter CbtA